MFTSKQGREVNRLIKSDCANYFNGDCIQLDCNCPQMISGDVCCRYFESSVLPLDVTLEHELLGNRNWIHCKRCKGKFASKKANELYCARCKPLVAREKTRARVQKLRESKTGIM